MTRAERKAVADWKRANSHSKIARSAKPMDSRKALARREDRELAMRG